MCDVCRLRLVCFFFKQKTAYEMRISDWSSDVCSSDLVGVAVDLVERQPVLPRIERLRRHKRRQAGNRLGVIGAELRRLVEPGGGQIEIGRASCRERVCQYV